MAIKFNIHPYYGNKNTEFIDFVVEDLVSSKPKRIYFENASSHQFLFDENGSKYIYVDEQEDSVRGRLQLEIPPHFDGAFVSIFANVEEKVNNEWKLTDIAANIFQINNNDYKQNSLHSININPNFVSTDNAVKLEAKTTPNNTLHVFINGHKIILRSDEEGYASRTIYSSDLNSEDISQHVMHKFPIMYASEQDGFEEEYFSGVHMHFIPSEMHVLQSLGGDLDLPPECVVLDPDAPGSDGDEFVGEGRDGVVIGGLNRIQTDFNCSVGTCNDITKADSSIENICRIQNNISTDILPNGALITAYSAQTEGDIISRPRAIVSPGSNLHSNNPIREGTILSPSKFNHSLVLNTVSEESVIKIQFNLPDIFFEIIVETLSDIESTIQKIADEVNNNSNIKQNNITAIFFDEQVDFFSDSSFTMNAFVSSGVTSITVKQNTNNSLQLFVSEEATSDIGDQIAFTFPKFGKNNHDIISIDDRIIRFKLDRPLNPDIDNIFENDIFCEPYIIVNSLVDAPNIPGFSDEVTPDINLPPIADDQNRILPCANIAVASRKSFVNNKIYVYFIAQAPNSDGAYQLFFYGTELNSSLNNFTWKQITFDGENKNPICRCDGKGNLHIIWESDRSGLNQIYYSVLGCSSNIIVNKTIASVAKKASNFDVASDAFVFDAANHLPGTWRKMVNTNTDAKLSIDNRSLAVECNMRNDDALALYSFNSNPKPDGSFHHLSYEISCDYKFSGIQDFVYSENEINKLWENFKSQFKPIGNHRFDYNSNRMSLDKSDFYFQNSIPILGSYAYNIESNTVFDPAIISPSGGVVPNVDGFSDTESDTAFEPLSDSGLTISHPSLLRHFMIVALPEKIRFKATNLDPLFVFCDNNDLSIENCDGYVPFVEEVYYTGRYKLAFIASSSLNDSNRDASTQSRVITREFGPFLRFDQLTNIKVTSHYTRATQEQIDNILSKEIDPNAANNRFLCDILVSINEESLFAESFFVNLEGDNSITGNPFFNAGFGKPWGTEFITNESLPFDGNQYENIVGRIEFDNITCGPPSVKLNPNMFSIGELDRFTSQIFSNIRPEENLVSNASFEDSSLPASSFQILDENGVNNNLNVVNDWIVSNNIVYHNTSLSSPVEVSSFNGDFCVEIKGVIDSEGNPDNDIFGEISQTIPTVSGQDYILEFWHSTHPLAHTISSNDIAPQREVKVSVSGETKTISRSHPPELNGKMNWEKISIPFTASSNETVVKFTNSNDKNVSGILDQDRFLYSNIIDSVSAYDVTELIDESSSVSYASLLGISNEDSLIRYSVDSQSNFTQIPITFTEESQNINADLFIDPLDKCHVSYQTNRYGNWEIEYTSQRDFQNPFEHDIRITDNDASSINPSVCVDKYGRRFISWQDNRDGHWQIYSAISDVADKNRIDSCLKQESDLYIHRLSQNSNASDPYGSLDPYGELGVNDSIASEVSCSVNFDFIPEVRAKYHFSIAFYEDQQKTKLKTIINSKTNISGWRVNGEQMPYDGASLSADEAYVITYIVSNEDDLSDNIYYLDVEYESVKSLSDTDITLSGTVIVESPSSDDDIILSDSSQPSVLKTLNNVFDATPSPEEVFDASPNVTESDSSMFAIEEGRIILAEGFDQPNNSFWQEGVNNGNIVIEPDVNENTDLIGLAAGNIASSVLFKFDPVGQRPTDQPIALDSEVTFTEPIVAIIVDSTSLSESDIVFSRDNVSVSSYNDFNITDTGNNTIFVSSDRRTIKMRSVNAQDASMIRVITSPLVGLSNIDSIRAKNIVKNITNASILPADSSLDLSDSGSQESDNAIFVVEEKTILSPIDIPNPVTTLWDQGVAANTIKILDDSGGQLDVLQGVRRGDLVSSIYLKFDPSSATTQSVQSEIEFSNEILAIAIESKTQVSTETIFGLDDVVYADDQWNVNEGDTIIVSSDGKKITLFASATDEIKSMRIIVAGDAQGNTANVIDVTSMSQTIGGDSQFVFYCPEEQSARCDVNVQYLNDASRDITAHFRINFYTDTSKQNLLFSSFTLTDQSGWRADFSGFPGDGITLEPGDMASVYYDPEILPHNSRASQEDLDFAFYVADRFAKDNNAWELDVNSNRLSARWSDDFGNGTIAYKRKISESTDSVFFVAPRKFLDNKINYYGGQISWDIRLDASFQGENNPQTPTLMIKGENGNLRYGVLSDSLIPSRSNDFTKFTIDIINDGLWEYQASEGDSFTVASEEQIKSVIKNINNILLSLDFYQQEDQVFLNNFEMFKQGDPKFSSLLCGTTYYVEVESFVNGTFRILDDFMFSCLCGKTDDYTDKKNNNIYDWRSSAQGGHDTRVCKTDSPAINPRCTVGDTPYFYVTWEDYRYVRTLDNQPFVSPDHYYAIWIPDTQEFESSAQGEFDRRITVWTNNSKTLFSGCLLVDQLQNINFVAHDGFDIYYKSCTLGCKEDEQNNILSPDFSNIKCLFADSTVSEFFKLPSSAERNTEQYSQLRLKSNHIAFSTYSNVLSPLPVVNDCFVELDVIGVPGTYAYRLKNENDNDWTEWLPIGADLPDQNEDADVTEERSFFRAYFIGRDRFIAPWILSSNNGLKKVCCQIMTPFGRSKEFCLDLFASYVETKYKIEFFFDSEFTEKRPKFKNYPVISKNKTETNITEDNLISISEDTTDSDAVYVKVTFENPEKIYLIDSLRDLDRYASLNAPTIDVYQQGLRDILGIPLVALNPETHGKGSFGASFRVAEDDNIINKDGLALVVVNFPGNCVSLSLSDIRRKFDSATNRGLSLQQSVEIFEDMTLFKDAYLEGGKDSFAEPNYYKIRQFGQKSRKSNITNWSGGKDGPIRSNQENFEQPPPPPQSDGDIDFPEENIP